MNGFIQPQWSGFSGSEPDSAAKADIARHKAEREELALSRDAEPAPGTPKQVTPQVAASPLPVTSPSPRRHKALTP